ncbi:MAG: hypothetical protein M3Z95_03415, partial [Actinomycetota bacterium]|nr:hypothetical protein [Actinomycetota bacterium]
VNDVRLSNTVPGRSLAQLLALSPSSQPVSSGVSPAGLTADARHRSVAERPVVRRGGEPGTPEAPRAPEQSSAAAGSGVGSFGGGLSLGLVALLVASVGLAARLGRHTHPLLCAGATAFVAPLERPG